LVIHALAQAQLKKILVIPMWSQGSSPEISAAFRRMALNVLQRDTTIKENIRGKRLRAGWDDSVRDAIYAGFSKE
jgi:hypothetical protein